MPFASINRFSFEALNQNYRAPGVLPQAVPPGRGDAASPQDPSYRVNDEFIRVIPFVPASVRGGSPARQFQVRTAADLEELPLVTGPAGTPWISGKSEPFGQDF